MDTIFAPLKAVAGHGLELTSADGAIRRGHLVLACYPDDYPGQSLVTCTRYNVTCPKCDIPSNKLGNGKLGKQREQNKTLRKIHEVAEEHSKMSMNAKLKSEGLNHISGRTGIFPTSI